MVLCPSLLSGHCGHSEHLVFLLGGYFISLCNPHRRKPVTHFQPDTSMETGSKQRWGTEQSPCSLSRESWAGFLHWHARRMWSTTKSSPPLPSPHTSFSLVCLSKEIRVARDSRELSHVVGDMKLWQNPTGSPQKLQCAPQKRRLWGGSAATFLSPFLFSSKCLR